MSVRSGPARWFRLACLALVFPGAAAKAQPAYDETMDSELVQIFVSVTDRQGRPVRGLGMDDFRIFDSEEPQPIVAFSAGDTPFSAVLVLDASESMRGKPWTLAREAAAGFFGDLGPLDLGSLVAFGDRLRAFLPLSSSRAELVAGTSSIEAGGGTALFDALYLAAVYSAAEPGHRAVVLVSDGEEMLSALGPGDVEKALARARAQFSWIRPRGRSETAAPLASSWRTPAEIEADAQRLVAIATRSGGVVLDVKDHAAIRAGLRRVTGLLRGQYALAYRPQPALGSGTFRPWRVEVRGVSPSAVRVAAGFFDAVRDTDVAP